MRILILSDIHGNLEALQAILLGLEYQQVAVLGDLVGYGANPNEVIDLVRQLNPIAIVRGNHDKVAAGISEGLDFNATALEAIRWTQNRLTESNRDYLHDLPVGPMVFNDSITIAHGSPMDEEEYIFQEWIALRSFQYFQTPICFYGHSHVPMVIGSCGGSDLQVHLPKESEICRLPQENNLRYLINPGSVGQPRDNDPRACAAILDTDAEEIRYVRAAYDVSAAQERIRSAGLPDYLADRLALGR